MLQGMRDPTADAWRLIGASVMRPDGRPLDQLRRVQAVPVLPEQVVVAIELMAPTLPSALDMATRTLSVLFQGQGVSMPGAVTLDLQPCGDRYRGAARESGAVDIDEGASNGRAGW